MAACGACGGSGRRSEVGRDGKVRWYTCRVCNGTGKR